MPSCCLATEVTNTSELDENNCFRSPVSEKTRMVSHGKTGYEFKNWSTTFSCKPELYFEPTSVEEIQNILSEARRKAKKVKVIGNGHSPSDIACTKEYMVSLKNFKRILKIDKKNLQVTVEAGITLTELNGILLENGMALRCLGSVSEISVGGCISTGTHGTGKKFGILATNVLDIELLSATGEIIYCSQEENTEIFNAARCHLGALGVLIHVTLQLEPAFNLHDRQSSVNAYEVLEKLEEEIEKSEHFRMGLFPHLKQCVVWHNTRTTKPAEDRYSSWFWDYGVGYHCLEFALWLSSFFPYLVPFINWLFFELLYKSPREMIDTSFKVFNFECLFKQYVTEWAIPREKASHVLKTLLDYYDKSGVKAHFPIEVRFVKGDDIYLSPCYGRDSCFINIIMYRPYNKFIPHKDYWKFFESLMFSNGGRPHWAKKHQLTAKDFEKMYPKFNEFVAICKKLDPNGMFRNEYLDTVLFL